MKVLFVAGFGPIVRDVGSSRGFYEGTLGIQFEGDAEYPHTEKLDGCRTFALWRLEDAAESCFGTKVWPSDLPVPSTWLEFDVNDMAEAVAQLQRDGYRLIVADRKEPWGQTVTRLLSPEGILVGVSITPWMRDTAS